MSESPQTTVVERERALIAEWLRAEARSLLGWKTSNPDSDWDQWRGAKAATYQAIAEWIETGAYAKEREKPK